MVIEECSSRKGWCFTTITLTYDEIRDIANGLYYVSKDKPEYKGIKDKCKVVFDTVKHGMIQPETIESMANKQEDKEGGGDR